MRKLKFNQQEQVASGIYAPKQDRNPTPSSRDNDSSKKLAEMRKEMKKMSIMISQLTKAAINSGEDSIDSGNNKSDTEVTNATNRALARGMLAKSENSMSHKNTKARLQV